MLLCFLLTSLASAMSYWGDYPYKCMSCQQGFNSRQAQHQHDTAVGHIFCNYCSEVFNSGEALSRHKRDDHSWECNFCDKIYNLQRYLDEHTTECHNWPCDQCDRVCHSQEAINQHTRDSHGLESGYCDRVCHSQESLYQHTAKSHSFKCKHCDRVCSSQEAIDQHTRATHQTQTLARTRTGPAAPSVATITKMVQSTVHTAVHTAVKSAVQASAVEAPQKLVVSCNTVFCGAKFTSVEARDLHISKIHQHTCGKCIKVFASAGLLFVHRGSQHQFRCTVAGCKAHFDILEDLKSHSARTHKQECDKCEEAFGDFETLLKHRDSTHQFRCSREGCRASFNSSEDLEDHLSSTSHVLACSKCRSRFSSIEILLKHMKDAHSFSCDHEGCDALFDTPESRSLHSRTSHRHKCDKCKQFFPSIDTLLGHRDSDHQYSCITSGCDAHFCTEEGRILHAMSHQYMCVKCDKLFPTPDLYLAHHSSTHEHRCNKLDCGALFESEERLKTHLENHEHLLKMMAMWPQKTPSTNSSFYNAGKNNTASKSDLK